MIPLPDHSARFAVFRICRCARLGALMFFVGMQSPAQDQHPEPVRIQVDPAAATGRIADDFLGFGYESSAVAQAGFFSPRNATLVRLYKNLSPHGLVRIGGIISDHARYEPDAVPVVATQDGVTVFNQAELLDLGGFLQATGWKVMWGLNLGTGSREEAVREAEAVKMALGGSLQSLQIGNEVENLRRFNGKYESYHSAYRDYQAGIRAVLPDVPFSGPDSVGKWSYLTPFAATEGRDLKLLTVHYYRGSARGTNATLANLLQPDIEWNHTLGRLQRLCAENALAYRINEVNSFYGGGKEGVSDTFGSALWCLDYLFNLAAHGCAGANLETDINQLGFISHYSPIVHDPAGRCSVRPEYYGMLAFALAGKGNLLRLDLKKSKANLTAYATRENGGSIWITVINKDFARDTALEVALPQGYASVAAMRLSGPAMESKDHVTLAGAEVFADGTWRPGAPERVTVQGGVARLPLPHANAVLLELKPQ